MSRSRPSPRPRKRWRLGARWKSVDLLDGHVEHWITFPGGPEISITSKTGEPLDLEHWLMAALALWIAPETEPAGRGRGEPT